MRSAICVSAVFALSAFGMGQQLAGGSAAAPVQVTDLGVTGSDRSPVLKARLESVSSKKIVGYVVLVQYFKPDGVLAMETVLSSLVGLAADHPRQAYVPGEAWIESARGVPLERGIALPHKISVDYVLFADQSEWGPDVKKQSLTLKGVAAGWRAAYGHLARVVKERGSGAAVDEISSHR